MPMLLRHNAKTVCERKHRILQAHICFPALDTFGADQGYAWVPVDYRWREPKGFIAIILAT